jgi:hypothetical protein
MGLVADDGAADGLDDQADTSEDSMWEGAHSPKLHCNSG